MLANLERWAGQYDRAAFVIVENDSDDATKQMLTTWLASREQGHLVDLDGLANGQEERTERLASARNAYLDFIFASDYADFDDLVVLDFDDVNSAPVPGAALLQAREHLWSTDGLVGVFANARPFYYDVWALRHPQWSPDDCWARVQAESATMGLAEAQKRFIFDRQISIRADRAPIPVDSAFGGLAVYRLSACKDARYAGLDDAGAPVCEHVSFNDALRRRGGALAIYPALTNRTSPEHVKGALFGAREMTLSQGGRSCTLYAPAHHKLDAYRRDHPLYDRRLPELAALIALEFPGSAMIDVGANIGDSIALCRLAGANLPMIAVDASLTYCKYLWANVMTRREVFGQVSLVWGFVGSTDSDVSVALSAGTATAAKPADSALITESVPTIRLGDIAGNRSVSLVKTDTDGHDHEVLQHELEFLRASKPALWLEAQTDSQDDENAWGELLRTMAEDWPLVVVFDNYGFAIWAGALEHSIDLVLGLLVYARRRRTLDPRAFGNPTLHYLDLALFPESMASVYADFTSRLPELDA